MKTKRTKTGISLLTAMVLAALALNASAAVVSDTFDVPTGTAQDFNLQTNQAARQSGSTVGVTYSDASANILAATQVYLTETEAYDSSGVLAMRNLIDAAGAYQIGAAGVGIDQDLAPQLAGTTYTISYDGLMIDRLGNIPGNTHLDSWYQGFSLGGSNLPYEPSHATTDLGVAIYQNNAALIYTDGVLQWAGILPNLSLGSVYGVELDVDEVAGTASVLIDAGGTVTNLGTYAVGFEAGETSREMQFINRVATRDTLPNNPGWDIQVDAQVNNLEVIPEPATVGLFALAGGLMFLVRKIKRFPLT